MLTINDIIKPNPTAHPPEHHIIAASPSQAESGWTSYLPLWGPSPARTRPSLTSDKIAGFRNPWPSWHKPTLQELWDSFQWGEHNSPCIDLATSHLTHMPQPHKPDPGSISIRPSFSDTNNSPTSPAAQAAQLLRIQTPDFSFPTTTKTKAKVTWLGHASVLVQLPSLSPGKKGSQPIRYLFDPIFSPRCSPSKLWGPTRSYPPPCAAKDLPLIDAVFISHNHYDHMDQDSLMAVWRQSREQVRFFVPLGNKKLLVGWGIEEGRVVEMDWWEAVELRDKGGGEGRVKVWCTPAQHNSFRSGGDAGSTLWASWTLERLGGGVPGEERFRVFFAGDTGYQFHREPGWPFTVEEGGAEEEEFPACPAFAQIRERIGPPDLLLLPVSVGATYAYLRSFFPLPDRVNPFPRHGGGVSGANHMPPWDAVKVLKVMTEGQSEEGKGDGDGARRPVAVAMHWGTFVTDPVEVLATLGELEWSCQKQGVRFARDMEQSTKGDGPNECLGQEDDKRVAEPLFVAVNHGQSICI